MISDKGEILILKFFKLPLPSHEDWGVKPVAYLESDDNKIYLSS